MVGMEFDPDTIFFIGCIVDVSELGKNFMFSYNGNHRRLCRDYYLMKFMGRCYIVLPVESNSFPGLNQ